MNILGLRSLALKSQSHLGSKTSFICGITSLVSMEALTLDEEEIGDLEEMNYNLDNLVRMAERSMGIPLLSS